MQIRKRNNRRIAIAFGLLLIFVSSTMIKSMHYHHEVSNVAAVSSTSHHAVISTSDYCPICQYLFSPTTAATTFHVFFIATLLSVLYFGTTCSLSLSTSRYYNLRAPPAAICR